MGYIRFPIETDPETLVQDIYDYIRSFAPQWVPSDGNLDVWIIRAIIAKVAENRDLASDVQDSIFRYFGAVLMGIPPLDATQAVGTSTWTMINNAGYTIPAGTNVSISDGHGGSFPFYTVADVVVAPGSTTTSVGGVTLRALNPGIDSTGLGGMGTAITLIDIHDFIASAVLTASTAGGSDAETDATYLDRLVRRLQRLSQRPILPQDFADAALQASTEAARAVAIDLYSPFHNLLTLDEASFETGVTHYAATNAVIVQSATFAADLANSMRLTASSAADMFAELTVANGKTTTPGKTVTGLASFRAATTVRNVKVGLRWYDVSNALIGTTVFGAAVADTNTGFTQVSVTAVAPTGAVKVALVAFVVAPANTEIHYVDKASLRNGTTTDWVAGGTPETGNDRTVTVAAVTTAGTAVSSGAKTAIDAFLQANREVNFVAYVMDAKYTNIDVAVSYKLIAGFNEADIDSDVVAAITNYLSPTVFGSGVDVNTWVETTKVYYNELIALASSVNGVDRVTDLTSNIHGSAPARVDITIDNPAGLTTPGTITAAVV